MQSKSAPGSILAIEPIAVFFLFMGYWPSNNTSRDHGIKDEFISLTKAIVLCTIRKRILCWSIFAIKSIADFCTEWVTWPWFNEEFASHAKTLAFGTVGKIISFRLSLSK